MTSAGPASDLPLPVERLEQENAELRERLQSTEEHMARTLMRATRLSQVISLLGTEKDLETTVERAAVEVGELFFCDMALLILGSETELRIAGHWGVGDCDLPSAPFALPDVEQVMQAGSVRVGPVDSLPLPDWLASYSPRHLAWARLMVGDRSLGLMLLVRRGDDPFEESEETELRAVAYRIALAIENGVLHQRMTEQLAQLHRLQQLTEVLSATLDLEVVGRRVAEVLVSEAVVPSSVVLIDREGEPVVLSSAGPVGELAGDDGRLTAPLDGRWTTFPLVVAGKPVGLVAVTEAPAADTEQFELLAHLVSLGALALDKALLYEQSREQARHDSLTGLLGHRVFQEMLEAQISQASPFSVVVVDIDDFKQVNDLHGHQTGDEALCLVSDALRQGIRTGDSAFRTGGEEFCALLPGLGEHDAFAVAEGLRQKVIDVVASLPNPVTISVGVASFPVHGGGRVDLMASADAALYASKRAGKNCTSVAGGEPTRIVTPARRGIGLDLLHKKDPDTVSHSLHVAILTVEIARALGLADCQLEDLRIAARLHDIGKIAVPDAILNKPGALDDHEFLIVKTHPVVGAELMVSWGFPGPAEIVRQHHEHIDGSGYPAALRGNQIAIESRIIHAVDAFVAMTRDRPYRRAMGREEAFAELRRHSGTQFDPAVVDALVALEGARPAAASVDGPQLAA
jgi:diguanylate cyclase (GGDEF)-like protein/putative nucleotidyltransferase with HDIG domain